MRILAATFPIGAKSCRALALWLLRPGTALARNRAEWAESRKHDPFGRRLGDGICSAGTCKLFPFHWFGAKLLLPFPVKQAWRNERIGEIHTWPRRFCPKLARSGRSLQQTHPPPSCRRRITQHHTRALELCTSANLIRLGESSLLLHYNILVRFFFSSNPASNVKNFLEAGLDAEVKY